MKFFDRKKRAYTEVFLVVIILILFITAHYLLSVQYADTNFDLIWMGLNVSSFIVDLVLYLAIFLTFILFLLVLHRNFIVRGKRKR